MQRLNELVAECEQHLLMLRDYVEMNWNGWDKDWAEDQIYTSIGCIRKLIIQEETNE